MPSRRRRTQRSQSPEKSLEICLPHQGAVPPSASHDGEVWACDVSPDGYYFATAGGGDGKVVISDNTGKVLKVWKQDTYVDGICFGHPGRDENILFNTQRLLHKMQFIKLRGSPKDVSFGQESTMPVDILRPSLCRANGTWLAVAHAPDRASIIDVQRQTIYRSLVGHTKPVTKVEWCPGSTSTLITGSEDAMCFVWDNKDPNPTHRLGPLEGWVYGCGLTCDGRFAIGGTFQGSMTIWDLRMNKSLYVERGHYPDAVQNIVTVPEEYDKHFARFRTITTGNDGMIRLWSIDLSKGLKGVQHSKYLGHTSWITDAKIFTPTGGEGASKLFTCGHDGRAIVWDLPEPYRGITLPLYVDPAPLFEAEEAEPAAAAPAPDQKALIRQKAPLPEEDEHDQEDEEEKRDEV